MSAPMPAAPSSPGDAGGGWSAQVLLGLLVAEFRKTLSTSAWWALLIPAAVLSMLVTLATLQGGGLAFTPALGMALALSSFTSKLAVVYGVICASGEFRHRTITTSYLTAAGRTQLLVAKWVVAALVGAVYAVVSVLLGVLGLLLGGGGFDGDQVGPLLAVSSAAVLTFALWAVLGVGLGSLISNQLAGIVGVLVYLLLVEQVIVGLASLSGLGQFEDYLPGGAANATLTTLAGEGSLGGLFGSSALPWWLSLAIFAGYTSVAVLAGAATAERRDIT